MIVKINLGNNLNDAQRSIIHKKFGTSSIFSAIPIKFADNQLLIGFGTETEDVGVWDELYRKLGCQAHCV